MRRSGDGPIATYNAPMNRGRYRLYDWFERIGWPRGYRGRVVLIALLGVNAPIAAALIALLGGWMPTATWALLLIAGGVAVTVSVAVALLLGQLLEPVSLASQAVTRVRKDDNVPRLPTHYRDDAGRLLHGLSRLLHTVKRQQSQLDARENRDYLTGLFTRSMGQTLLEQDILYARREGVVFSVALLDIDRMELVNGAFGRAAGDEVLRRVGHLVQVELRGSDWAARWSGASMLIVLYAPAAGARLALERLRSALVDMEHPVVTVSVGCVAFQPIDTSEELLARAAAALADAKRGGRNQVRLIP